MKIPAYLFLFFLLVSASCRQQDYPRLLAVADSLMDTRPDSAWQVLRGISPEALSTEGERMRHRLLTVEAECRNGQMPANDSLLLPLIGYFQRGGEHFGRHGLNITGGVSFIGLNDSLDRLWTCFSG